MTTQTATPRNNPRAQAFRMANVLVDVAETLGGLGVTPAGLGIDTYSAGTVAVFGISVNITPWDVATVDAIAAEVPGDWARDYGRTPNYERVGMVRFGGEVVRIRVYTGRPTGGAL